MNLLRELNFKICKELLDEANGLL